MQVIGQNSGNLFGGVFCLIMTSNNGKQYQNIFLQVLHIKNVVIMYIEYIKTVLVSDTVLALESHIR